MPYHIPEQPATSSPVDLAPPEADIVTSSDPFYIDFIDRYLNLGTKNPLEIVLTFINIALSFIGIIFLCMILYTGVLVLLSGGQEERLQKAKKTFFNALIGLGVIFVSYSLTQFIMSALIRATGANESPLIEGAMPQEQGGGGELETF